MKNSKVHKIAVTLILVLLMVTCATTVTAKSKGSKKPKWFDNREKVYPEGKYLSAIGEGDTRKAAESDAAAALSRIFESKIQSTFTDKQRYAEITAADQSVSSTNFNEISTETTIGSNQTLSNIKYGDIYTDKTGRMHTIAYLDRFETGNIYRNRIEENGSKIGKFIQRAKATDKIIEKYAYLDTSTVLARTNDVLISQLEIISPMLSKAVMLPYNNVELIDFKTEVAKQLVFSVVINNDTDRKIYNLISELLGAQGLTIGNNPEVFIDGDLKFEEIDLKNNFKNVKWFLSMNVKDKENNTISTINENQRESALSVSQAKTVAYKQMEKKLKKNFIKDLFKYFDSMVQN